LLAAGNPCDCLGFSGKRALTGRGELRGAVWTAALLGFRVCKNTSLVG